MGRILVDGDVTLEREQISLPHRIKAEGDTVCILKKAKMYKLKKAHPPTPQGKESGCVDFLSSVDSRVLCFVSRGVRSVSGPSTALCSGSLVLESGWQQR